MANKLVGGLNASTAQRVATATEMFIRRPMAMLIEVIYQFRDGMSGVVRMHLHVLEPANDMANLAVVEPGERRFGPLQGLPALAIARLGYCVHPVGAVVIIENLTRCWKQLLGLLPYPGRPIGDDTEAHLVLGDYTGRLEVRQRPPRASSSCT